MTTSGRHHLYTLGGNTDNRVVSDVDQQFMPYWKTTAISQMFQIFDEQTFAKSTDNADQNNPNGKSKHGTEEGKYNVMELSPNTSYATIYQDIATVSGKIYEWRIDHAARLGNNKANMVAVVIGKSINAEEDYHTDIENTTLRWGTFSYAPGYYLPKWQNGSPTYTFGKGATAGGTNGSAYNVIWNSVIAGVGYTAQIFPYGRDEGDNRNNFFADIVKTLAYKKTGSPTIANIANDQYQNQSHVVSYNGDSYYVYISNAGTCGSSSCT